MENNSRRLFDLLAKNAQKRAASQLIAILPADVRGLFEGGGPIYHPEVSERIGLVVSRYREMRYQGVPPLEAENQFETMSKSKAWQRFMDWAKQLPSGEYLLVPSDGNWEPLNGVSSWVSRLPGYPVSIPESLGLVARLKDFGVKELVLASDDRSHAVMMDTSGGVIPDEPFDEEVIYELASWGLRG